MAPVKSSASGLYETTMAWDAETDRSTLHQSLAVPWSFASGPERLTEWSGTLSVAVSHEADGKSVWSGAAEASGPAMSTSLFIHRPHRSSADPFKFVHSSARTDNSIAFLLDVAGQKTATVQFVNEVRLKGEQGPLLFTRTRPWPVPVSLTFLEYGSRVVRHRFIALDGHHPLPSANIQWGAAWQTGVEVDQRAMEHRRVLEGAGFLRGELTTGKGRGWLRLHGTSDQFRSLAAESYPFARGRIGVEGRWQWRPGSNRLLSAYGQRLYALGRGDGTATSNDEQWEMGYSYMPRRRWGWRLSGSWKRNRRQTASFGLEASISDSSRRLQYAVGPTIRPAGVQWRHKIEWNDDGRRLTFTFDSQFAGHRMQWTVDDVAGWGWTFVYKRRSGGPALNGEWFHGEVRRRIGTSGQLWMRYMDPDRGRLDVGWQWPTRMSGGVRIFF